jgi:hypothetical protein
LKKLYNAIIAAGVVLNSISRKVGDLHRKNDYLFDEEKEFFEQFSNDYPFKEIYKNLEKYIPLDMNLKIHHIEMSQPVKIEVTGISDVILAINDVIRIGDLKKLREFLELQKEFGDNILVQKYQKYLESKLDIKIFKSNVKLKKVKDKHNLDLETVRK